jgi:protein-tyrosine phosphatase
MQPTKVLFVCLGNICRSPLAEGIFRDLAIKANLDAHFEVDSAGTAGYHIGESPDARTMLNARKNGLAINHRARQFLQKDFEAFHLIVVMDQQNLRDVLNLSTSEENTLKVKLLREWDSEDPGKDVPDPWFGGEEGFEEVYQIIRRSTSALFEELQRNI